MTIKPTSEHVYTDYSRVAPDNEDPIDIANELQALMQHIDVSIGGGVPGFASCNFPMKLFQILSKKEYSHIVTWMPHGRSWKVLDRKEFTDKIITKYFSHKKFSSFTRQVNAWGFRRITHGDDKNSYYHELFLRGMPHLLKRMKRLMPSVSKKLAVDPEKQPDFYLLSIENPLPQASDEWTTLNDLPVLPSVMGSALGSTDEKPMKSQESSDSNDLFGDDLDFLRVEDTGTEDNTNCSPAVVSPCMASSSSPLLAQTLQLYQQQSDLGSMPDSQKVFSNQSVAIPDSNLSLYHDSDLSNKMIAQDSYTNQKLSPMGFSMFSKSNTVDPSMSYDPIISCGQYQSDTVSETFSETTSCSSVNPEDVMSQEQCVNLSEYGTGEFLNAFFQDMSWSTSKTNECEPLSINGNSYYPVCSDNSNGLYQEKEIIELNNKLQGVLPMEKMRQDSITLDVSGQH